MMTRSPFSSRVSVNLILGRVDGACCANATAANASIASNFMKAPDGNTYSTRWRGRNCGIGADGVGDAEDTMEKHPMDTQTQYEDRIYWAAIYLHRAGCLERVRRGVFKITALDQDFFEAE